MYFLLEIGKFKITKNTNYFIIFGWNSALVTEMYIKWRHFYIKADSRSQPKLDLQNIFEYAIRNADILKTEFRHWKIGRLL